MWAGLVYELIWCTCSPNCIIQAMEYSHKSILCILWKRALSFEGIAHLSCPYRDSCKLVLQFRSESIMGQKPVSVASDISQYKSFWHYWGMKTVRHKQCQISNQ